MKTLAKLSVFVVGTLMLLAALSPALAISTLITAPTMSVAGINGGSYESTNWSGYAVTDATAGSVTSASGSWIVPAVTGSSNSYAAFWVGIDGFSDSTVEQTGTISYMNGATPAYYAWVEFYPAAMVQINTKVTADTIAVGNIMNATVSYSAATKLFTATITDVTKGWTYTTTATVSGAKETSAEWIAEAPSSNIGILPLADFKTADYGYDYTAVTTTAAYTCCATVAGTTGVIGSFGTNVQSINMVTNRGVLKDSTSALSTDGSSFTVTWDSSGSSSGFGR